MAAFLKIRHPTSRNMPTPAIESPPALSSYRTADYGVILLVYFSGLTRLEVTAGFGSKFLGWCFNAKSKHYSCTPAPVAGSVWVKQECELQNIRQVPASDIKVLISRKPKFNRHYEAQGNGG
ncbi:hypothetical protein RCC89_08720 [Cytophagaceae bacterium ABcell3]|nr:hypothetical protein RCC89_08720 [Cytophagaceae bacterium ABcell3]